MNTTYQNRLPRFTIAIAAIVTLLIVVLLTPPGRTFAQNIFQFFTQAETTTFSLESSQIIVNEPDPSAPTAMPPTPLISIADAEAQVGFDAAELPFVPDGFEYLGVRVYGNMINIEYETQDKGSHLTIQQSEEGFYQSDWDKVPEDVVIPVKIGPSDGEFVQGTFVVYPGETLATWNPNAAILRLRWKMNGIFVEMTKFGNVASSEYLNQTALIKIAEQLVFTP